MSTTTLCGFVENGKQCNKTKKYPLNNPTFCYEHYQYLTGHGESGNGLFNLVTSDTIPTLCQMLIDEKKYKSVVNFMVSSRLAHELCQPLMNKEKIRLYGLRPISFFVTKPISDKKEDMIDLSTINQYTTPDELYNILKSKPTYRITDMINNNISLIHHLVDVGNINLIKHLTKFTIHGKLLLEIASNDGNTPLTEAIRQNDLKMVDDLIDLGAPLNIMTPILNGDDKVLNTDLKNIPHNNWDTIMNYLISSLNRENLPDKDESDIDHITKLIIKLHKEGAVYVDKLSTEEKQIYENII